MSLARFSLVLAKEPAQVPLLSQLGICLSRSPSGGCQPICCGGPTGAWAALSSPPSSPVGWRGGFCSELWCSGNHVHLILQGQPLEGKPR